MFRILILINCLISLLKTINSDCGIPGMPFNAQIDKLKHIYYEGDSIQYRCQLEELKLIGNNSRLCADSRWSGAIPKCVEELTYGSIKAIEITGKKNYTNWQNQYSSSAFYGDYSKNKCLPLNRNAKVLKLYLNKVERHISYIEIVINDINKELNQIEANKIIKSAKVNDLRECSAQVVESESPSVTVSVTCLMQFDGDSIYEAWERDATQLIAIQFDAIATVCEIKIYLNSFMPFHRCGSPDVVLHSTMEFVKRGNKYGSNSYYKYKCEDGFQLEGIEDVRCGLNNHWLDEFPSCRPLITCPFPPSSQNSTEISFQNLFSYGGNISAVMGSIASYKCKTQRNNSIMFGDSVRTCEPNKLWSGTEPFCIDKVDFNYKTYENFIKPNVNMTTIESFDSTNNVENERTQSCGIPAMPLFAKPSYQKTNLFSSQADVRHSYPNGTMIYYQCESAYRWLTGDVDSRICINGKWVGRVGKCAINWGNKLNLNSIAVYDEDNNGKWITNHLVSKINQTNIWDEHFAYRRDPDKGNCASFAIDSKHKWVLRLNQSAIITYFTVMLHPGGFFGSKRKINNQTILANSPVSAEIGERKCELTSVWDFTHNQIGSFFFFSCDMYESKYRYQQWDTYINIYIDPQKFISSYKSKNISLCSLAVMVSKGSCGTPDIPINSLVNYDSVRDEWSYTCNKGYELVGKSSVKCGRNGRWLDEFPVCRLAELCPVTNATSADHYQHYYHLLSESVAVKNSLVKHWCAPSKVLIGSSLRLCAESGHWSGSEAFCFDSSSQYSTLTAQSFSWTAIVLILLSLSLITILGVLYLAYNRGLFTTSVNKVCNIFSNFQTDNTRAECTVRAEHLTEQISPNEPNFSSYDINEEIPVFSSGNEFLVTNKKC